MGTLFGLSCSSWLVGLGYSREYGRKNQKLRECLFGLFGDLDSARSIGKRYLALYPNGKDRALLLAEHIQIAQLRTSGELIKVLAGKRELDFQNSKTVLIDGWILARTEVEVCALTVLL
jgi:hypothetical protein